MMEAPSSCAPCPTSHESMWPPITTTSSGWSVPRISPITSPESASGSMCAAISRCTRTGTPSGVQALQHGGILGRDGGGWNFRLLRVVLHGAGMRNLHGQRRGGAYQHRDRAQSGRAGCAAGAVAARRSVALEHVVVDHDLALAPCRAPSAASSSKRGYRDHVRRDTARRRADAHPQSQHVQRLIERRHHAGRFGAAHPVRHLRGDDPHIAQARRPSSARPTRRWRARNDSDPLRRLPIR